MIFKLYQEDFDDGDQYLHLKLFCWSWWEIWNWGFVESEFLHKNIWNNSLNSLKKYLIIRKKC